MATKIKNFVNQKKEIDTLAAAIDAALKQVGEQFNVNIKTKGASYDATNVTFKLSCDVIGENGEIETQEAKTFKLYAELIGFKKDDLGKEFKHGRDTFRITGYKPKSKNGLIANKVGTTLNYKFAPELVKQLMTITK